MNTEQLREAVLSLSAEDRANIARDLLNSLDSPGHSGVDSAWLGEIEKRAQELADGSVVPVDWDEARDRIAHRLHERRK